MSKAQYICRYLNSTPNYSLVYDGSGDEGIIAFMDSDWAADCYDFKRLRQSSTVVGSKVQVLMSLEECKS